MIAGRFIFRRCPANTLPGTDPTAGELRRDLRGVNLDGQQFATLLQTQQDWDSARAQLEQQLTETGDTNLQKQIDALAQKHDQTFEGILGTNGLAVYEKQQDSRYLELQKNASLWGLNDSNIDYIYGAIEMYEDDAAAYQRKVREMESAGVKLDSDDINQPWAKYETEMAQYVRTNLTEAQYEAVTRNQILPFVGQ
ncbi:MAG TPA: hypothetical protein VN873_14390 [Candidatus Angelobacter sp.]|nr:hypothetical protein [Candidatus Angelobacter sp.]